MRRTSEASGDRPRSASSSPSRSAVPVQSLLGGRTVAFETSEVRPQVNGLIRRRIFTEGSFVRQGQPLYQIDPSLYHAAVNQAPANLASARATLDAAQARANRYKPLAEMEAISKQDYTDAAGPGPAGRRRGRAEQRGAARRRRSTCASPRIPAPISGRIGRSLSPTARWSPPTRRSRWRPSAARPDLCRHPAVGAGPARAAPGAVAQRRRRRRQHAGPAEARGRQRLRLHRHGPVHRSDGQREHRHGDAAGALPQSAERAAARHVRAGAASPRRSTRASSWSRRPAVQRDIGGDAFVCRRRPGQQGRAAQGRRRPDLRHQLGRDAAASQPGDKVITQGTATCSDGAPIKPVPASAPQRIEPRPAGAGGGRAGRAARPCRASSSIGRSSPG